MILNSPFVTGSITVTDNVVASGSLTVLGTINGAVTGSVDSASYAAYAATANSASFASTARSSSFASTATSSSFASTATSSSFASTATSASQASNANTATSSSYALVSTSSSFASTATSASQASNANTATSASQAANAITSSYAANADLLDGIDSARFALTGSNTFTGTQYVSATNNAIGFTSTASVYTDGGLRVTKDAYISGTIYVNNLTVYGTQSINYITSSQLNIGTNIITVNTDVPAVRFGGLAVYDSGSTRLTGSMLWDSEQNRWIYSNPSGSSYDGGMILSGPRNTSGLGNEQGTLSNVILKGQGGDHVTSSLITETGTATTFYTNALYVTSSNRVGIGTTVPTYSLDVSNVGGSSATERLYGNDQANVRLRLENVGSGGRTWEIVGGLPGANNSNFSIYDVTATSTRFNIDSSGAATFSSTINAADIITSNSGFRTNALNGYVLRDNANSVNLGGLTRRSFWAGGTALDTQIFAETGYSIFINPGGSASIGLTLASTGVATFSSSVTAGNGAGGAVGGYIINYAANTGSRSWRLINDQVAYGDFAIQQSTTQTGTSYNQPFYINPSGNVGIGTTSPGYKLEVSGNAAFSTYVYADAFAASGNNTISAWGATPVRPIIEGREGNAISNYVGLPEMYYTSNAYYNGSNWIRKSANASINVVTSGYNNNFLIQSGPSGSAGGTITFSTLLYVNGSNGYVSIGTNSPVTKLSLGSYSGSRLPYINGTSNTFDANGITVSSSNSGNAAIGGGLDLTNNTYSVGAYSPIISFSSLSLSAAYNNAYAGIWGVFAGAGGDSNWNVGHLAFGTANSYGISERMRITSAGDLLIGTTSSAYSSSGRGLIALNGSTNSLYGWLVGGNSKGYLYHNGSNVYLENSVSGGSFNILQVGAGNINLSTNGSTRMTIQSNGYVVAGAILGNQYSQTSSTGTTSIVDTGITYNTGDYGGYGIGATYQVVYNGNPNAAGSGGYNAQYVGILIIYTGYSGSAVTTYIQYTQLAGGTNIGSLTLTPYFWNGSSQVSSVGVYTGGYQIRLRIDGYNSSYVGASQSVYLTKLS